MEHAIKIIRLPEVQEILGLSKPAVYGLIKKSGFPAPIKLGAKASGWLLSEVNAWIAERAAARAK